MLLPQLVTVRRSIHSLLQETAERQVNYDYGKRVPGPNHLRTSLACSNSEPLQ
jgi:hypothetical protein